MPNAKNAAAKLEYLCKYMFGSHDAPAVLHIKTQTMLLFRPQTGVHAITVPPDIFHEQTVRDAAAYQAFLSETIVPLLTGAKALCIVVSDELTAATTVPNEAAIPAYLATVPIPVQDIRSVTHALHASISIIVTNATIYAPVQQMAAAQNIAITAILPQIAFQTLAGKPELSEEEYELLGKIQASPYNFLHAVHVIHESQPQPATGFNTATTAKSSSKRPMLLLGIITCVLIITALFLVFYRAVLVKPTAKPLDNPVLQVLATPLPATASPSATPIGTPSAAERTSLRVQVLNGTSIQGAAAKLAAALENTGYLHITTGNGKANLGATTIAASQDLTPALRNDLTTIVQTIYPNATANALPLTASNTAIITIGLK